jgi:hypothetical protein
MVRSPTSSQGTRHSKARELKEDGGLPFSCFVLDGCVFVADCNQAVHVSITINPRLRKRTLLGYVGDCEVNGSRSSESA